MPNTVAAAKRSGMSIRRVGKYQGKDVVLIGDNYFLEDPRTKALTPVNTTTLKIQYSNDGANWADGATIVSNNAADATDMVQLNNYGRYTRVYATLSGSDPVTITVLAVAK